jgi:hypothetical protein
MVGGMAPHPGAEAPHPEVTAGGRVNDEEIARWRAEASRLRAELENYRRLAEAGDISATHNKVTNRVSLILTGSDIRHPASPMQPIDCPLRQLYGALDTWHVASGGDMPGAHPTSTSLMVGRAILVACLAAGMVIALPEAASAEACGSFSNRQVGWGTWAWTGGPQPYQYEGVSARITDEGGYVLCTTDQSGANFSTSWTMVFSNNSTGWAQSGTMYRYGYGSCVKRWSEQSANGTSWVDTEIAGCSIVGETHRYWQQTLFVNGAWRVRSNIDNTVIRQSTFSPFSSWVQPFHVSFSSETYYAESHVPGTVSFKQDYSDMQVQKTNDLWYDSCTNVYLGRFNSNPARWSNDAPACNHVRSWTVS